ncbi:MAG: di-trans,poly-cis-decaprenylcistransferase [Euryarchaeota archaeon]|nr:di-trans,poly-cis-decaprenylcistransferase [Euryarchaeota archaeon]
MAFQRLLDRLYRAYERLLLSEVREGPRPRHVAVIMDGNRRFAERRGQARSEGHFFGVETTEDFLYWCQEAGVPRVTLYAFSTENFDRTPQEKQILFHLMREKIEGAIRDDRLRRDGLRVTAIGDLSRLPPELQESIRRLEDQTRGYGPNHLYVALAYGGRQEIVEVVRHLAGEVARGALDPRRVTEETIARHLYGGPEAADVDLIIRTGGELRTSNFLPWQASGNECATYFCAPYWPEFRKVDLLRALRTFQQREDERRRSTAGRVLRLLKEFGAIELKGPNGGRETREDSAPPPPARASHPPAPGVSR